MKDIKVPDMGDTVTSATISMWHHKVGDLVKDNDDLVELVTDKATFNVPCGVAGKISKLAFNEGDTVKAGDVIAVIDTDFQRH